MNFPELKEQLDIAWKALGQASINHIDEKWEFVDNQMREAYYAIEMAREHVDYILDSLRDVIEPDDLEH